MSKTSDMHVQQQEAGMRTIIAGSRGITNIEHIMRAIHDSGFEIAEIISGGARGVDTLAICYAKLSNIPFRVFPADWDKHGKSAGVIRNVTMAHNADALIAIWDGTSRGTKHMIDAMTRLKKPVHVYTTKGCAHNRASALPCETGDM